MLNIKLRILNVLNIKIMTENTKYKVNGIREISHLLNEAYCNKIST